MIYGDNIYAQRATQLPKKGHCKQHVSDYFKQIILTHSHAPRLGVMIY